MSKPIPCFMQGCPNPRIKNHVVCDEHHAVESCLKCIRENELTDRMAKRRATIERRMRE